ncbi:acyl-CoA dehydrogenase family protein [Mycobacterium branderi]|uniref:Acyl-CoA dehydrogenase C-terminal domain-containing protein n=1 Tax=Mycobacterium branderi TaxID=43348 RepID=A0A7I7W4M1_9MYCO|nr:hypothetical protein [Mycobacterium branderi]MCV7233955.1 hypothetical protein [Mycobacterium branderi]ORA39518.1 hypothetical protein BST20_08390 [Mycobacterium branderi]BBZ11927.1 hypothetical protein MBRA_21220 [Mycobacterium branderi]
MAEPSAVAREILDVVTPMAARQIGERAFADELIAGLRDSGVWRILQPVQYGGRAMAPEEFISVVCALAAIDGSIGWLTAMFNVATYHVAGLPHGVADEVWNSGGRSLVTACYRPEGQLVRSAEGPRLTGRWAAIAGAELADWVLLTALDDGGRCCVLVPRQEVQLAPAASSNGLRGAGICHVSVSGLGVDERRIFQSACASGQVDTNPPIPVVVGAGAAAVVVGAADGVWRVHVDQVRERLAASYGSEEVTDRMSSTVQVARAASDIDAANLQLATTLQAESRHAAAVAQRQAVVRARDTADRLLGCSRRHALDASDPVARLWQDVHAGCRLALGLLDGLDPN